VQLRCGSWVVIESDGFPRVRFWFVATDSHPSVVAESACLGPLSRTAALAGTGRNGRRIVQNARKIGRDSQEPLFARVFTRAPPFAIDLGLKAPHRIRRAGRRDSQRGEMDEAKSALTEARRLNPRLSVKWINERKPILRPAVDSLRKSRAVRRIISANVVLPPTMVERPRRRSVCFREAGRYGVRFRPECVALGNTRHPLRLPPCIGPAI
jgi:hypothetical protein